MVSNARLQPFDRQAIQRTETFGTLQNHNSYQFPPSGGVRIGSSSQAESIKENPILSSFGPGGGFEAQNQNPINIEAS
jgi:hypothetical protein